MFLKMLLPLHRLRVYSTALCSEKRKEMLKKDEVTPFSQDDFTRTDSRFSLPSARSGEDRGRGVGRGQEGAEGREAELDWYGNSALHHLFATNDVDIVTLRRLLARHPELAQSRNQFGRLPLHYALDRIRVNLPGLRLLLAAYPEGVSQADLEGKTPYDLAVKWCHGDEIKRLLLQIAPSLDPRTRLRLRYGPLASLAIWATSSLGNTQTDSHRRSQDDEYGLTEMQQEDEEEDEGEGEGEGETQEGEDQRQEEREQSVRRTQDEVKSFRRNSNSGQVEDFSDDLLEVASLSEQSGQNHSLRRSALNRS